MGSVALRGLTRGVFRKFDTKQPETRNTPPRQGLPPTSPSSEAGREREWARVTSTPVTLTDPHIGVAEAWWVVRAADDAWDGANGEWISFPPSTEANLQR